MIRARRLALPLSLALLALPGGQASAQRIKGVSWSLVEEVMPGADRFADAEGDPPVVRGYATGADGVERLIGYVFLTSDLPPEQYGYSGPIEALVGMTLDGTLTGVRVTDYRESYMRQIGDFLRSGGFQEQFSGKYIGDPFRVWGDVDGISRVTISVRALSRGVRDSARRVAMAYAADGSGPVALSEAPVADVVGMSWFEMRRLGVVERFEVTEPRQGSAGISLAYIGSDRVGEYMFGRIQYESALRSMARRDGAEHLMLYAVDGSRLRLFVREGWSVVQDGDTTAIDPAHIVMLGLPSGGVVSGEATMVGVMLIKRKLDIRKPFTFIYDLGELGVHSVEYTTQDARILMAEAQAADAGAPAGGGTAEPGSESATPAADPGAAAEPPAGAAPDSAATVAAEVPEPVAPAADPTAEAVGGDSSAAGGAVAEGADATGSPDTAAGVEVSPGGAPGTPDPPPAEPATAGAVGEPGAAPDDSASDPFQELEFAVSEDETLLERTLADTQWSRVATMLLVLSVAAWAFFAKRRRLRWVALTVTLLVLGFYDGGFLSVSHITSGIWAGAGVYLRDLPLLLIASFTVVTTLVWGRVFCGFLCPFGALQDFLERVVPRRFQLRVPQRIHDRALWVKYGILGVIVVPALAGSHASFYQYFEPFGTVFFLSSSVLFWSIAGTILLLSLFIPRFYCRYGCPLGAALALTSLVSLKRIERVEQCQHCRLCEQKCPTGAIRRHEIDFKECVRCNLCEVLLAEKRGVCRHDMEEIRPRLVQVEHQRSVGVSDA